MDWFHQTFILFVRMETVPTPLNVIPSFCNP